MLFSGKEIEVPRYDFKKSSREKDTTNVKPANLIIFEGILAFHDKVLLTK